MASIRVIVIFALIGATAAACGGSGGRVTVPPGAIAVVGDRTISRAAFDTLMSQTRRVYAAHGRTLPGSGTPAFTHLKTSAVRLLVDRSQLEQAAERLGISIGASRVTAELRRFKQKTFGGNERQYMKALRREGETDAQIRAALRADLLAGAVRRADPSALEHRLPVRYAAGFAPADTRR